MDRKIKIILAGLLIINFAFPVSLKAQKINLASYNLSATGMRLKGLAKAAGPDVKRFSLELKDIDIVGLLKIISEKTGLSIIPSSLITGRATFFLKDITPLEVLDVVLTSKNLAIDRKGDIIYVMTETEYEAIYGERYNDKRKLSTVKLNYVSPTSILNVLAEINSTLGQLIADDVSGSIILIDTPKKIVEMRKMIKSLDKPLKKKVFDIKYALAVDLKTSLEDVITAGVGRVVVDERNSKLIVYDLPNKLSEVAELIANLDEETRQIFIETEIIEITLTKDKKRGVNWEKFFRGMNDLNITGDFALSTLSKLGRISVGQLYDDGYHLVLDFLESYGETKILSQPHISVVNNQEATIMVGTRQPYATGTQSQGESTTVSSESIEFVDIGVKLSVKPTINKNGFIVMDIKTEASSQTETPFTTDISTVPIVSTSEAETKVKVKDGTTIILAGLIKDTKGDTVNKWPFLSKIPFLNIFFKSQVISFERTELAIFLTPHIMKGDKPFKGRDIKKYVAQGLIPEREKQKAFSKTLDDSLRKAFPSKLPKKVDYPFIGTDIHESEQSLKIKMKGLKKITAENDN